MHILEKYHDDIKEDKWSLISKDQENGEEIHLKAYITTEAHLKLGTAFMLSVVFKKE